MVVGPDFTRNAKPEDHDEIDALLNAAFGRPNEAELVHRLRADGDIWWEAVKPWGGWIAGYASLSRMQAPKGWACLAPVAVLPEFQNAAAAPDDAHRKHYAIGTRLVSEIVLATKTVQDLRARGMDLYTNDTDVPTAIVSLGSPSFFERAGFSAARARNLTTDYPAKDILIARQGDDIPFETLVFPAAFAEFEEL